MNQQFAEIVAQILRFLPSRISRAVFYRMPKSWFCFDTTVNHRGSRLHVWTGENIGRKVFFLNDFEDQQLDIFESLVKQDTVFFDIGANIGIYSLSAGKRGAKVYAFEPSPDVLPYLKKNIELNSYSIILVPKAVGEAAGTIPFFVSTKENMGVGRIMQYGKRTNNDIPPVQVAVDTIDNYSKNFGSPTFIKMDIEGAEYFALRGGKETLSKADAPVLMIEFHPGEIEHLGGTTDALMLQLREYGYHQYLPEFAKHERWYVFSKKELALPGFKEII